MVRATGGVDMRRGYIGHSREQVTLSLARRRMLLECAEVGSGFEELDGVSVDVDDVIYMPSLDHPEDRPHPFVYFIKIRNDSSERVCIQGRKWLVREDANDDVIVVEGDGVVGQTPNLGPGEEFSYNSYHVIRGSGYAEGSFFGSTEAGRRIVVSIPRFMMKLPEWA